MTREELLKTASAGGYLVDDATLEKALNDPLFFKAVYADALEDKALNVTSSHKCQNCGADVTLSASVILPAWASQYMKSLLAQEVSKEAALDSVLNAPLIP